MQELLNVFDKNIIMSETDVHGQITYVSEAFINISGYSKEELIGKPHRIVQHESMLKDTFKDLWKTVKSGKTWMGEIKNKRKDGTDYWVHSTISPKFRNGKIVGYSSIRLDITNKKIADYLAEENKNRQQFLDLLIDSLEQIVLVTNDIKISQVNQKFLEFYEITNLEEFHQHGMNCISDTFEGDPKLYIQKKTDGIDWTDYILTHRDKENNVQISRHGVIHIFTVTVTALFYRNEMKYVAIFSDVTQREYQLQKLLDYQKTISDSITYASYIQNAILPDYTMSAFFLKDSFFLWEPRDEVGGDIFFIDAISPDEMLLIVVDCTSHGVPGAFITMLVKAIQKQLISDIRDSYVNRSKTGDILSYFNREIKLLLNQIEGKTSTTNVGFDGGALYYNRIHNFVSYSGAETPLFYIENNEVKMIKGDRQSIGYTVSHVNFKFTEHTFFIGKVNQFYIMTDGFYDQVGGTKKLMFGKKKVMAMIEEHKNKHLLQQREIFHETLIKYQGTYTRLDDITFIGLKF
jgi:PAS domain S-box-containing protein